MEVKNNLQVTGTITGSNLNGTNTGDQTITLTGDVTGSGTGSFAATLANTAVTPGAYTSANITVDAKGRVTAAANGSGGGGGTTFAIGSMSLGPSAPDDGGTWLECNAQSISQSTYADLYTTIGHNYLRYKFTKVTAPTGTTTSSSIVYTGTTWLRFLPSSTVVYKSTDDGYTWSLSTALPAAAGSTVYVWTNENGVLLVVNSASTTAYRSTDHGVTWGSVTLPSTGGWHFNHNGANIIGIKQSSNVIITSTDTGATWATSGSTLPAALVGVSPCVWWTGSKWVIIVALGTGNNVPSVFTTTVASGASGWSLTHPADTVDVAGTNAFDFKPLSDTAVYTFNSTIHLTTDAGETARHIIAPSGVSELSSGKPIWNGLHFVAVSGLLKMAQLSTTGVLYNQIPLFGANTGMASGPSFVTPNIAIRFNGRTDKVNYRIVTPCTFSHITDGSAVVYIGIHEPSINTSTHFNVPMYTDVYMAAAKAWIKAL